MAASVQTYPSQGLAPATQRSYSTAMRWFHGFCIQFTVDSPFPVTEFMMCSLAANLADAGLAPQTIKAAVRSMQLSLGLPDPRDNSSPPLPRRVLAGIGRARLFQRGRPQVKLPITGPLLVRIHDSLLWSGNPDSTLIWVVASFAFFGFFCLEELMVELAGCYHLISREGGDVAVDNILLRLASRASQAVQVLWRWQSSVFIQYIRMDREQLARVSATLSAAAMGQVRRPA